MDHKRKTHPFRTDIAWALRFNSSMLPDNGTFQLPSWNFTRWSSPTDLVSVLPSCLAVVASVPFDEPSRVCFPKIWGFEMHKSLQKRCTVNHMIQKMNLYISTYHVEIENPHTFNLIWSMSSRQKRRLHPPIATSWRSLRSSWMIPKARWPWLFWIWKARRRSVLQEPGHLVAVFASSFLSRDFPNEATLSLSFFLDGGFFSTDICENEKICLCVHIYFHCWTIVLHGHFVQVSFAMDVFHCMKYFLQSAKKTSRMAQRVAQVTRVSQKHGAFHIFETESLSASSTLNRVNLVNVCVCETLTTTKIGKNLSSLPSKSVTTWQSLKKKELHLQAKKQVIKTIKTFMSKSKTRVSWAHLLDTGA